MKIINELWIQYNESSNYLSKALGRTSNIVGEFAEYLALKHYDGFMHEISKSSADFEDLEGRLYQVKSRKLDSIKSCQLGIIRSWNFHFLIVILFGPSGDILKALEVPVDIAKEYGVQNNHQNGWVITTSKKFLNDNRMKDISESLSILINN